MSMNFENIWYMDVSNVVATTNRVNPYFEWETEPQQIKMLIDDVNKYLKDKSIVRVKIEIDNTFIQFLKTATCVYDKITIISDGAFITFRVMNDNKVKYIAKYPIIENNNIIDVNIHVKGAYSTYYLYDIFRGHKLKKNNTTTIELLFKEEFPLFVEIQDVWYILAPRIEID